MARLDVDRELVAKLDEVLTPANTDKLLAMVPPDWTQLATKHDLAVMSAELRGDMAELRTELKTDMAEPRTEFAGLQGHFTGLEGKIAELRGDMNAGFASLRAEVHNLVHMQTYLLLGAMSGLAGLMVALK